MDVSTIVGLGFAGLFLFMLYGTFKHKLPIASQTPSPSTDVASSLKDRVRDILKDVPSVNADTIKPSQAEPTREAAIQAVFVLMDYARSNDLTQVGQVISDQVPQLIRGKIES